MIQTTHDFFCKYCNHTRSRTNILSQNNVFNSIKLAIKMSIYNVCKSRTLIPNTYHTHTHRDVNLNTAPSVVRSCVCVFGKHVKLCGDVPSRTPAGIEDFGDVRP